MKLISEGDPMHKPKAYTIVGQLGQKIPALINKDFSLLEKFFDTLAAVSGILNFEKIIFQKQILYNNNLFSD